MAAQEPAAAVTWLLERAGRDAGVADRVADGRRDDPATDAIIRESCATAPRPSPRCAA